MTPRRCSPKPSRVLAMRTGLTLTALALLAGCGVEETVSTTDPVTGPGTVYTLASANDAALPATVTADQTSFELRAGALTLALDSTFIFSVALRVSASGGTPTNNTTTLRGDYSRNGTAITLTQGGDTAFTGTYAPTSVSLQRRLAQVVGDRFVFVR